MYEDIIRHKLISDMKDLIKQAEEIEENQDLYIEFMKTVILNTYSAN